MHYPVAVIPVAPAINVDPTAIEVAQKPGRVANRAVTIRNQGNGPLDWALTDDDGCDAPAELPWLTVTQASGTVAPGGSTQIRVELDSAGPGPGRARRHAVRGQQRPGGPAGRGRGHAHRARPADRRGDAGGSSR